MDNEMHLIDANKLMVCHINVGTVMFPKMEAFVRAEDIKAAPIVDAEPVVHARWKESDFIPGMLTCTNCGVQRNPKFKLGGGAWNRCPNCGAKMDLKEE